MITLSASSTDHLAGQACPVTSTVYEIQNSYVAEVEVGEAIGNIIVSIFFSWLPIERYINIVMNRI
jgi:hypothetical protein